MKRESIPKNLSDRLEAADAREAVAVLRGLANLRADHAGITTRTYGRAIAIICGCLPTSLYNRVIGFDGQALPYLDEIIALYRAHDLHCRFDIVPDPDSDALASALRQRGFQIRTRPIFSNIMMFRTPTKSIPDLPEGVAIRKVSPDEAELLGSTHAAGLTYPTETCDILGLQLQGRLSDPDAHGFLAEMEDQPVATGLLSVTDNIGYFGHASTKPEFRGRGCQTALINARMAFAASLGCSHVVTFAVPDTASERNVQRGGFDIAHRLDVWMDIEVDGE